MRVSVLIRVRDDERRSGLVESDVAVGADAEQLHVDATEFVDQAVVGGARVDEIRRPATSGPNRRLVGEVDLVDELTSDEGPVRLRVVGGSPTYSSSSTALA